MFQARSLAWRTDLWLRSFHGSVAELDGCVRVETPSDPEYYSGNLLLFPEPPGPGDVHRWVQRFREAFAHLPGVRHVMVGWDAPHGAQGEVEPFLAAGFSLMENDVLTASALHPPPRPLPGLEVRVLTSDEDWETVLENHLAEGEPSVPLEAYAPFARRNLDRYRDLTRAGLGAWYGAFLEGRLVGDLGLFVRDGVGRFQSVGTHPDFRRRGVCGTLVHAASVHARMHLGADTLVIVAEADGPAERIYASVGFRKTERECTLIRRPDYTSTTRVESPPPPST